MSIPRRVHYVRGVCLYGFLNALVEIRYVIDVYFNLDLVGKRLERLLGFFSDLVIHVWTQAKLKCVDHIGHGERFYV